MMIYSPQCWPFTTWGSSCYCLHAKILDSIKSPYNLFIYTSFGFSNQLELNQSCAINEIGFKNNLSLHFIYREETELK